MDDRVLKHLYDVLLAARAVRGFVDGKTFDDYSADELLRSDP